MHPPSPAARMGSATVLIRVVLAVGLVATASVIANDLLAPDAPAQSLSPASTRPPASPTAPLDDVNVSAPTPQGARSSS